MNNLQFVYDAAEQNYAAAGVVKQIHFDTTDSSAVVGGSKSESDEAHTSVSFSSVLILRE